MTECPRGRGSEGAARTGAAGEQIAFDFGDGPAVALRFDSEAVTSDAGLAPLRALDERLGLTEVAASFIRDLREPDMVVHPAVRLVREVVYAYAAGYDDANDHAPPAHDTRFERLVGPANRESPNPKAHEGLASEAMVSRFLHARGLDASGLAFSRVEQLIRTVSKNPPAEITLDIDGYDAEVYGAQQLPLWNGHYEETMYCPVVVTAAEHGSAPAAPGRARRRRRTPDPARNERGAEAVFRGGLRAPGRGAAARDAGPQARLLRRGPLRRGVVAEEAPHRDEAAV